MDALSSAPSLTSRLQEKLDAAVQSPGACSKTVASVITDSDDESNDADLHASIPKSTYRDFSRVLPEKASDGASSLIAQSTAAKEPTFPRKLHMILSNPEFQDIISWLPHGRSWRILQQKAFEERVIPLYFRHGRYSSFARQVNGWGFRRVTHGSDYNSYYHEMFLSGMPHLCEKMRRLTNKDTAARKKAEDEPAPDFYALSRAYPLPEGASSNNTSHAAPSTGASQPPPIFDVEGALLERRRSDLLDRINMLASSNVLRQDPLASFRQQDLFSLGGGFNVGLGGGANGFNSLLRPMASMYDGMNVGSGFSNASLQQLLGGRSANAEMAQLLAMNNVAGFGARHGLSNPYGL